MSESEKIVPAYMKVKQNASESNNNKKNDKKKLNNNYILKNRIIFIVVSSIIIVALVFLIVFLIRVIKYSKYNEYCKQMDNYGLSQMYNNSKSTSFESVTKSEAIKIIISSITNLTDLEGLVGEEENYKNQFFVEYAVLKNVIGEDDINEKNADKKITFIEFIEYYANARKVFLNKNLDTSVYPNYSDISNITSNQLYALSDLLVNNVLQNSTKKIHPNKILYKGELNKITCDIIKKYNLLIPTGKRFNINEEKIPQNSDIYSYILFDVDKSTYEKPVIILNKDKYMSPIETFVKYRSTLKSTIKNIEEYYNIILNVDYENISYNDLEQKLENYSLFPVIDYKLENYIQYVKDNKIKLKGNAITQAPIIYYDGNSFRMRTKISFEILNAETSDNLLYLDLESEEYNIKYEEKKYEFFIDAIIDTPNSKSNVMYVYDQDIYSQKTDEKIEKISITKKEEEEIPTISE